MKRTNRVISLFLALVMLAVSCSVSMFAYADDGYQVTGKTDPNNRWSYNPNYAVTDAVNNVWSTAALALPALIPDVDFSQGLDDLAQKKLYTNKMIGNLYQLYGLLGTAMDGDLSDMANLAAAFIPSALEEPQYKTAADTFHEALNNAGDTPMFAVAAATAKEITDFGFADGDREGFISAALAALRPITYLVLGFVQVNVATQYAAVKPVLEAFGVENVMSEDEFAAAYAADGRSEVIKSELPLRYVLEALFDAYDNNCKPNPIEGIFKILPDIANVISSGAADSFIKTIVNKMGAFGDFQRKIEDLQATVNSMTFDSATINSLFANKELNFNLFGARFMIVLDPIDIDALASVKDYAPQDKLEAVFELVFKTVAQEIFAEKHYTVEVPKVDNEGNPIEGETEQIAKTYDNFLLLAPIVEQNKAMIEGIVPGAVEALNTANEAAKAGDLTTAYNELSGIIFRHFAGIKKISYNGAFWWCDKGDSVKDYLPAIATSLKKATSRTSGHTKYAYSYTAEVEDDVVVRLKATKEACKFSVKNGKATCSVCKYAYTVKGAAPSQQEIDKAKTDKKLALKAAKINSVSNFKAKTMTVSWAAVSGATNYQIRYRKAGAKKWTQAYTAGKTSYVIKKLAANGCYEFQLRALADKGSSWSASPWSNVNRRYYAKTTLNKVTAGKKQAKIAWKADKKASGYKILVSTDAKMAKGVKTYTVKGGSKASYTVKGLAKGKVYYVRVMSYKTVSKQNYFGEQSNKLASKKIK